MTKIGRKSRDDYGSHTLGITPDFMALFFMLDRSRKRPRDIKQLLKPITSHPLDDAKDNRNPAAVALGRLGGLKGGKARAASLSKSKRSQIASRAAKARWKNDR